jgi:hypothetical protein
MDVQKTLALSLSVVNLLLFFGSSMHYNQSIARLTADLKKIEETVGAVEKQLVTHVSQSVGATNTKVGDLKRLVEEAQRAAQTLKAQLKSISQSQVAQTEQIVAMLQAVDGVKEEDRKKLLQLVKPTPPPARRTVRFEDEEERESAPLRRRVAEDEDEDEIRPAPRRRAADDDDDDDDDDVERRLAAVRRRKQRS